MSASIQERFRRMLAAFEADLPSHDLGWFITKRPDESLVEDTTGANWAAPPLMTCRDGWFTLDGYAHCKRCNARFDIQHPFRTDQNGLAEAVEKAKAHTVRRVLGESCWGDVPHGKREKHWAAMDAAEINGR